MAPPRLYMRPHEQLVELLAEAKVMGVPFDVAWELAMRPNKPLVMSTSKNPPDGAIKWPTDRTDREAWRAALLDACDGIRRAYENVPMTPADRGVVYFIAEIAGGSDGGLVSAGRGISPGRRLLSVA